MNDQKKTFPWLEKMLEPDFHDEVDRMLYKYNRDRRTILDKLMTDPQYLIDHLWGGCLQIDTGCQAKMTIAHKHQACEKCTELGHLFDLEIDRPFMLECGRFIGRHLVVRNRNSQHKLGYDNELLLHSERIIGSTPLLGQCGFAQADRYLSCDNLTAEVLFRIVINEIILSPLTLLTAFQCSDSNYILEGDYRKWEDISAHDISSELHANNIFVQLAACLHQLNKYHTILGELDARSILIKNSPLSTMYDDVHIQGDFGLSFGYTPGTSMTVADNRICSEVVPSVVANVHPALSVWDIYIRGKKLTLYSIDGGTRTTFLRHRRAGIPLYPGTLETYITILVICCNHTIFDMIKSKYIVLWNKLWLGEGDREIIEEHIKTWQAAEYNPLYDEIIDALIGKWLRCDAVDLFWSEIKNVANN